jgi:N-acetylmuramoyl-L-alanine amidase
MRPIDTIIFHCSATPASMDIGAAEIDQWHKERGWSGIGYHYVIRRDGTVEVGRWLQQPGAHVKGHNDYSIGICLIGGGNGFDYTWEQLCAAKGLTQRLRNAYPTAYVAGHRDFTDLKECPHFDAATLFSNP